MIFGLALVALVALTGVDDAGLVDGLIDGVELSLVFTVTFGATGVDGGAIADPPVGRGFLCFSPSKGKGFLKGLATMLPPDPSEDDSFLKPVGSAVLPGGVALV